MQPPGAKLKGPAVGVIKKFLSLICQRTQRFCWGPQLGAEDLSQ